MAFYNARSVRCLTIGTISASDIAHHSLFTRANSTSIIVSHARGGSGVKRRNDGLAMEATDLQFAKLDVEVSNKILEDVATLSHKFGRLFVGQDLLNVLFGAFEVREEQNEHFLRIARDLDKVDGLGNHVEVTV